MCEEIFKIERYLPFDWHVVHCNPQRQSLSVQLGHLSMTHVSPRRASICRQYGEIIIENVNAPETVIDVLKKWMNYEI